MPIIPVSGEVKAQDLNNNFSHLDSKIEQVSGGPIDVLGSETELKAKYPSGSDGFVLINGDMWFWDGTKWVNKGVYPVEGLGDKSVKESNLDDDAVSLFKIMNGQLSADKILEAVPVMKSGKNLFNVKKMTYGYFFNGIDLTFSPTNAANGCLINVSEFAGQSLRQNYANTYVIYDSLLNPLEGHATNQIIKLPTDAHYIGITIFTNKGQEDTYQLETGQSSTGYEPFEEKLSGDLLEVSSVDKNRIKQNLVEASPGKNLFNKNAVVPGTYPNFSDGQLKNEQTFSTSNWIEVDELTTYIKTDPSNQQYCYYAERDTSSFIIGYLNGNILNVPSGAKYLLIAARNTQLDLIQVEKGSEVTSYEPYGEYVRENQLDPSLVEKINEGGSTADHAILLPSKIFLTNGELFSIYWRNVINNSADFLRNCSVRLQEVKNGVYSQLGTDTGYKWYYTPQTAENKTVEIRVFNKTTNSIVTTKTINLIATDVLSVSVTKTAATIGDSFTDGNNVAKYIHEFVKVDPKKTYKMIGVNSSGVEGVQDDAWSGYGIEWFHGTDRGYLRSDRPLQDAFWDSGWGENEVNGWTTGQSFNDLTAEQKKHGFTKNQFYNPAVSKFDFSYYMKTYQSNAKVDAFVSMIGLNDTIWIPTEALELKVDSLINKLTHIVDSVKSYDATIKVLVGLVTPQDENDSFMNSYSNTWLTSVRAKRCQEIWNKAVLEKFDTPEMQNKGVYVMANHASFDSRYGLISGTVKPVKYLDSVSETIITDVHPNAVGSQQIADNVRNTVNGVVFT